MKMWYRTVLRISAVIAILGVLTLSPTAAGASTDSGPRLTQQASTANPVRVAPSGEGVAAAEVCGYYEDSVTAWYNHCGDTHVLIYVDATWPRDDWYWCIGPGLWDIGGAGAVNNAWYAGQLC